MQNDLQLMEALQAAGTSSFPSQHIPYKWIQYPLVQLPVGPSPGQQKDKNWLKPHMFIYFYLFILLTVLLFIIVRPEA